MKKKNNYKRRKTEGIKTNIACNIYIAKVIVINMRLHGILGKPIDATLSPHSYHLTETAFNFRHKHS